PFCYFYVLETKCTFMALNNREISNKFRVYHRYLGFFLTGIMFVYALSGITLTFRNTDYFKKETVVEKTIDKGLERPPLGRGDKLISYNAETGALKYIQKKPPLLLGAMEKMHKATSASPLFFLNIFFGVALLFFVLSAFWMFLPQTEIFKKAIYFTLAGMLLTVLMLVV
ncbi:MAG: hypothetical protein ACPGVF_06780, partial [Flavobacteriaceae bacterium]